MSTEYVFPRTPLEAKHKQPTTFMHVSFSLSLYIYIYIYIYIMTNDEYLFPRTAWSASRPSLPSSLRGATPTMSQNAPNARLKILYITLCYSKVYYNIRCIYIYIYIHIYIYLHTHIRSESWKIPGHCLFVDGFQQCHPPTFVFMMSVLGCCMDSAAAGNICLWFPSGLFMVSAAGETRIRECIERSPVFWTLCYGFRPCFCCGLRCRRKRCLMVSVLGLFMVSANWVFPQVTVRSARSVKGAYNSMLCYAITYHNIP